MELASLTVSGVLAASFLALAAIGLTLTFGIARFANIAHTDYMTLGAYGVFLFNGPLHLPLWVSVILGLGAAIILGVASALLAFDRLHPVAMPITLGGAKVGQPRLRTTRSKVSLLTGSISRRAKLAAGRPPKARPQRASPKSSWQCVAVGIEAHQAAGVDRERIRLPRLEMGFTACFSG